MKEFKNGVVQDMGMIRQNSCIGVSCICLFVEMLKCFFLLFEV